MSDISIYACGGCGINIAAKYQKMAKTTNGRQAAIVGIDFSGNNIPADKPFPIVNGEGGSGKVKATNYEGSDAFIGGILTKHKPGKFNIVLMSASGGSGSLVGPELVLEMIQKDKPVICVIVGDKTSDIELSNNVKTFKTLDNYRRRTGSPIAFIYVENKDDVPRGEIDRSVCNKLDFLSLLLTEENEEMDYQDIRNFLCYTNATSAPATLSQMSFFDDESVDKYNGKVPVAVASLYSDRDDICNRFNGTAYRATGVFRGTEKPENLKEFHATLDHGESVDEILSMVEQDKDRSSMSKTRYTPTKELGDGTDGPVL